MVDIFLKLWSTLSRNWNVFSCFITMSSFNRQVGYILVFQIHKNNATILIRYFNDIFYWIPLIFAVLDRIFFSKLIWHQVYIDWIRRFDSRAIILWQCHFQNVSLFPRKQAWSSWNLLQNQCWQKHNCPHFEKEDSVTARHSLRNFVALNSNCFKPACGGKVAHFETDTASEK